MYFTLEFCRKHTNLSLVVIFLHLLSGIALAIRTPNDKQFFTHTELLPISESILK